MALDLRMGGYANPWVSPDGSRVVFRRFDLPVWVKADGSGDAAPLPAGAPSPEGAAAPPSSALAYGVVGRAAV